MSDLMPRQEWINWKTRLTRAQNRAAADPTTKNYEAICNLTQAFLDRGSEVSLPDDWQRFNRACADADWQMRYMR